MAINNQEIVESITSQENAYRLEAIICKEIREWKALPLETRWLEKRKRIRKQAQAEAILREAKQEVDSLIGEEYGVELPPLEKRKSGKPLISSYISGSYCSSAVIIVTSPQLRIQ